ncbi:MAG: aminoacyl-tRNA hydrolase [Thermoleophilia bacterium]|nr:aminoacyl-tRNA hydrolase [Thermoleophilia bacterium]
MVRILDDLDIPEGELTFTTSRSSGPGGQNVNKVNTRVTLLFDVDESPSLSEQQRQTVRTRLAGRINREGVLRVVSQRHRTQLANRETAVQRFANLLREALTEMPERVPVKLPETVNEKRLEAKRRRSRIKRERVVDLDDEG